MAVTILFSAISLLLLVMSFWLYLGFSRRLDNTLRQVEATATDSLLRINKTIGDELRPKIHVHDSREMVTRRAADLIRRAAEETDPRNRYVTFYGAASLSASASPAVTEESQEQDTPEDLYNRALDDAARAKVIMRRYVSLFSEDEFLARSSAVQKRYLAWLIRQQHQLATDELYQLIDVVRAPKWGANMARIITRDTVMEITGNGRAAIIIEDETASATIREYARQAVLSGQNKGQVYSIAEREDSLDLFRAYVNKIREAFQETSREGSS